MVECLPSIYEAMGLIPRVPLPLQNATCISKPCYGLHKQMGLVCVHLHEIVY